GGMMVRGADNPWSWPISSAVLDSLSVLLLARIGRRLLRSTTAALLDGLLLALAGGHLVHSRNSLGDPLPILLPPAAFGALLIDRDRFRERLALASAQMHLSSQAPVPLGVRGGLRPWRLAAGLLLGMACAVKWSGLYFVAVFGIMTVLWDWWARRTAAQRDWFVGGLVRDAIPAFFAIVGTALVTYVASW